VTNAASEAAAQKFRQMVALFKRYGEQYDVPWLVVAAQAFQESQIDQSRRSAVGAVGPSGGRRTGLPHFRVWLQSNAHGSFTISGGGFDNEQCRGDRPGSGAGSVARTPRRQRLGLPAGAVQSHADHLQPSEPAPSGEFLRAAAPSGPARLDRVARIRQRSLC
jgi:hypothetical protein